LFAGLGILEGNETIDETWPFICPVAFEEDVTMENVRDPRLHVNEEPRDDLMDTAIGFGAMFGFMFVVFAIAVIIKFAIS
jgi:hypothetical protein